MITGYPPSHRNVDDGQLEVCANCNTIVSARRLQEATAEGLRGHLVCDVTPTCRDLRHKLSYNDLRPYSQRTAFIGQSRLYEAGLLPYWTERPTDDYFTPRLLANLEFWMRNDAIPYTATAATWGTVGTSDLPQAAQTTASSRPDVEADPFTSDYRGLEFETAESMVISETITATGAFTYAIALRTPAALADTFLVQRAASSSGIKALSTGAVQVVLDGGTAVSVAAAGTLTTSTNYVLTITRTAAGVFTCRRNGSDVTVAATQTGDLSLSTLGNAAGGGMTVTVAEELFYSGDHTDNIGSLERVLSYLVGVSL